MAWTDKIAACFGNSDLIFAGHPSDEDRAFALLTELRTENIGWREASAAIRSHLVSKAASPEHVDQQMADVEKRMKSWLLD